MYKEMLSDEALEQVDEWRDEKISYFQRMLNLPQRGFKPPYGNRRDFPHNTYLTGARFNVGMDVFKIISYRTRGRRPSIVARFDGTLSP